MKSVIKAAAPAFLLLFGASAQAEGLMTPSGVCILFCNAPVAAPSPTEAAPLSLETPAAKPARRHRSASSVRAALHPHNPGAAHALLSKHSTPVAAAASSPPAAQTAASPAKSVAAASPVATAPKTAALSANAMSDQTVAAPALAAKEDSNPLDARKPLEASHASEDGIRQLAQAFGQASQQAPVAAASPAPVASVMAPAPAAPTIVQIWRERLAGVNAKWLVLPPWPSTLPGRTGVWLALAGFAGLTFGGVRARGRRNRQFS